MADIQQQTETQAEKEINIKEAIAHSAAKLLAAEAERLDMQTLQKLSQARNNAVAAHQRATGQMQANGTLVGVQHWLADHWKLTGFVLIGAFLLAMQLPKLGEESTIDTGILAADLPVEAFVDTSFAPALNVAMKD